MADIVKDLSEGLASAVKTVESAVVRVEGRRRLPASGVVWPDEGIVVTANHVLERDDSIRIGTSTGDRYAADLYRNPAQCHLRIHMGGRTGKGGPESRRHSQDYCS